MTHRPPGTFHPPRADELAADQQRRLHLLEQRPQPAPAGVFGEVTITNGAALTEGNSYQTGRWWPWRSAMRLQYVMVTADGVSDELSEPCVLTVRRSGVDVVSIAFDGDTHVREGHNVTWAIGDWLDATFTGDVALLVVQLEFAGSGNGALQLGLAEATPS